MAGGKGTAFEDWEAFLPRLNAVIWQGLALEYPDEADWSWLPAEARANQWFGQPGATEEQLVAVEQRLGVRLSPSYRAFLAASNGWLYFPYPWPRLLSIEEIGWYADSPDAWIVGFRSFAGDPGFASDPEFGRRCQQVSTTLQISEPESPATWVLNPSVLDVDGDWEAWLFPGAELEVPAQSSFWLLMQAEFEVLAAAVSDKRDRHARAERVEDSANLHDDRRLGEVLDEDTQRRRAEIIALLEHAGDRRWSFDAMDEDTRSLVLRWLRPHGGDARPSLDDITRALFGDPPDVPDLKKG